MECGESLAVSMRVYYMLRCQTTVGCHYLVAPVIWFSIDYLCSHMGRQRIAKVNIPYPRTPPYLNKVLKDNSNQNSRYNTSTQRARVASDKDSVVLVTLRLLEVELGVPYRRISPAELRTWKQSLRRSSTAQTEHTGHNLVVAFIGLVCRLCVQQARG